MYNLYKLSCLKPIDRRIILQITLALPLVVLGLKVVRFSRLFVILGNLADWFPEPLLQDESIYVERVRQWVRYTKREAPYLGNCLSRSLVLWWLLRRKQIECVLRIGTRKQNGEFQAHAWLEYGGKPLNAGALVRQNYATFDYDFMPETVKVY